jgi:hypothetical protein
MKIITCLLLILSAMYSISNCLISQDVHNFVTMDSIKDKDFSSLLSSDWT